MNAAVKEDEAAAAPPDGPGRQLKLIREQRGLELERVAALLHLSEQKLNALEADSYEVLPGVVFVQGYLRNYARLLGVPVEPLLSAFHKLNKGHERPPELHISQVRHEVRSSHALVRLMTWIIVIGLIALVVIWWRGYLQWPLKTAIDGGEAPVGVLEETGRPGQEAVATVQQSSVETLTIVDANGEATLSLPAQPAPDDGSDAAAAAEETESLLPLPQSETSVNESLLPLPPVTGGQGRQEPLPREQATESEPEPAEPVSSPGPARVVVTFAETSWAEIRDASGRLTLLGEISAGTRHVLEGNPPYKMVLGNAPAVSISVSGRPFDLAPYTRGKVARLTLNPDQ